MDHSQGRLILILSGLLLAAAGVIRWQSAADPDPVDSEATAVVWEVDAEAVTAVTLERRGDTVDLVLEDGVWWVSRPSDRVEADPDQVDDLLGVLAQIERGIPVEVPDDDLEPFGLADPPQTRVQLVIDGETLTLDVGTEVPITYRTYVRGAQGGVVAVNGDANRILAAPASQFRDHRMFRFDPGQVRGVRIEGPDGVLAVAGQGHDWWLEGFTRAEPDRVDDLVMGLLDLRFAEITPVTEGIDDPAYVVTVTLEGQPEVWLQVGQTTPLGVVVQTSDGRVGFMLEDLVRQLGRGPTDVGIQTAFGVRMDHSDRVTATFDDRRFVATRSGPDWSAEGMDPGRAYDAVQRLADVGITYGRTPPDPPDAWGLVEVTEASRVRRVAVGRAVVDGLHPAVDLDGGLPFRIPAADLEAVMQDLP